MIGYIIFFLCLFSILRIKESQKKISLSILIVVLFSTLRYGIGYDYYGYYNDIVKLDDFILSRYEPIPKLFMQLAHWLGIPEIFFFLSSLFISYFFFKGIQKSKYINDSIIFYICFPLLFMDHLGIIRQGMATAVIFYAITSLKGQYFKQVFFIFIAILCHKSAFSAFALLLPLQKLNRLTLIALFISSFIIGDNFVTLFSDLVQSLPVILSSKYNEYIEMNEQLEGNKMRYLLYIITFLSLLFYKKLINLSEDNKYFIALLVIGCSIYVIFININTSIAKRIAMFFFSSSIIVIPYFRKIAKVPSNMYNLFLVLLMSFSIYVSSKTISSRAEDRGIYNHQYPYRTIFQK